MKVGRFDTPSYIMGETEGERESRGDVIMETDAYTFTDANSDGNVVIEEAEDSRDDKEHQHKVKADAGGFTDVCSCALGEFTSAVVS